MNYELRNHMAVCFQVVKGVYIPLLIAAGGGGRGYNGHSESLMELVDHDISVPGLNGMSGASGEDPHIRNNISLEFWML